MLKQNAALEVSREDRVYTLNLPAQAALGEVHDVLYQMRSFVVEKIIESQKNDAPKPPEDVEQPKQEVSGG